MKVMQINCHYKYGSTGKIVYEIHNYINKHNNESYVCYGRGLTYNEQDVYRVSNEYVCKSRKLVDTFFGRYFTWGRLSSIRTIGKIKKVKPDIVHIHCCNAYMMNVYWLLKYLAIKQIKTVVTLHAEIMYTGGCDHSFECEKWFDGSECRGCQCKTRATRSVLFNLTHSNWKDMKKAFDFFSDSDICIVSVSEWLKNRAVKSPMLSRFNHQVIMNGLDTGVFHLRNSNEIEEVRNKYGLRKNKMILHVTSSFDDEIKGGKYVKRLADKIGEDVDVVVVGPHQLQNVNNIIFLGIVKDQNELAKLYSAANVVVLTSKRETYSMVCVESLSCGTPVVGFFAGAPETICIDEFSKFCEYGDEEKLYNNVNSQINENHNKMKISKVAQDVYSSDKMASAYFQLYRSMKGE